MKINSIYDKFIKWNSNKITLLSYEASDKIKMSLIKRLLYLKNNYCFFKKDEILVTSCTDKSFDNLNKCYDIMKNNNTYYTLLGYLSKSPSIVKVDNLAEKYFKKYMVKNHLKMKILKDENIEKEILKQCVESITEEYKRIKIFRENKIQIILNEIKWIKNFGYESLESYQKSPKHNGIIKNSRAREGIYKVKELFEYKINKLGYITYEDMLIYATEEAKLSPKFLHILIDEGEKLTYLQWNFLKSLQKKESYSSFTLTFNIGKGESVYSPFIKNGRIYVSRFPERVRKFNIKIKNENCKSQSKKVTHKSLNIVDALEKFKYFDLRHKTNFTMIKDYSGSDEILVNSDEQLLEYSKEDIAKVPMFTNIAAGEPIFIDSSLEDNFSMPKQWIKGLNNCFILKVKGDSMINANINDGDFVVINKQTDVIHNDIVAANISGSATLKRLSITKKGVFLMPENEKYSPIPVTEEGLFILGKAVGIIRRFER